MAKTPASRRTLKRPRSVTLITVGVITLGLVNFFRVITLYRQIDLQIELGVTIDPRFRMVAAVIWVVLLFVAAVSLWTRRPWSRIAVPVLLLLYAINRLVLGGILAESAYSRKSQLVIAILYATLTAAAVWLLNRKAALRYFEERAESRDSKGDRQTPSTKIS